MAPGLLRCVCLLVLCATSGSARGAAAQTDEVVASPLPKSDAPVDPGTPDKDGLLTTIVLGFKPGAAIDAGQARTLNETLVFELSKQGGRRVIGRADLRGMLELEASKQLLGCDDVSCMAEIGQALDADRMVQGTLERVGEGWFILVTELDARSLKPVARVQRRIPVGDFGRLLPQMRLLVLDLATAQAPGGGRTGVLIVTSSPTAEVLVGGRSYGFSPAVIDDAPTGTVQVELVADVGSPARVRTRVFAGEVSTIDAQLNIERGASPEEVASHGSLDLWTRIAGGAIVAGGCATCLLTPCFSVVGLAGDFVGLGQVTTPNATFHSGYCLAFGGFSALSLAICGTGGGIAAYGGGAEPESEGAHRFVITPPAGRGPSSTVDVDPVSGERLPALSWLDEQGFETPRAVMLH